MLPAATLALLLLLPMAAASGTFEFAAAEGVGPFSVHPQGLALFQTRDPVAWALRAEAVYVRVVDDRVDNSIANPFNPDDNLVAVQNRTVTTHEYGAAVIDWRSAESNGAVSIIQAGISRLDIPGKVAVSPQNATAVERSHYVGNVTVGADDLAYAISVPPSLRTDAAGNLHLAGDASLYSWGNTLTVRHPTGVETIRTGYYEDSPTGSLRTRHYVHAFVELRNVTATLSVASGNLFAGSLRLDSHGTLQLVNLTGELETLAGPGQGHGAAVGVTAGSFALTTAGTRINGAMVSPATAASGLDLRPAPAAPWWVWPAAIAASCGLLVLAILASGRRNRMKHDEPFTSRMNDASVAFAGWGARLDGAGWTRLSAACFGLATLISPHAPELECEYAILLRQAGFPKRALRHHAKAAAELAIGNDPGCGAINAFGASLSCAMLGRHDEAIDWLQQAIEQDSGLRAIASREPSLRALRAHPDYFALMGAAA